MASFSQRRMLSKQDEEAAQEVQVRRQDQDKINKFSRLHQRALALDEELDLKTKEKEEVDDLATELELADEDEKIRFKVGDAFFHVPLEQAQQMLESSVENISQDRSLLEEKMASVREEMTQLKVDLYARFGKQINLET
ncbi:putative Gim complex component GIM3 [Ophiocordyceps camponoti-floridani]|uniref:Prefoldin subunit 4 n=1 Tax=Ophiocordyceps camponoti-floridani TaxID=2030778 RepID=A0A8H4Q460_9HYPO|nr:putative Gim complex component GIM3 [Ophiocordyceps camponoti-floridani]